MQLHLDDLDDILMDDKRLLNAVAEMLNSIFGYSHEVELVRDEFLEVRILHNTQREYYRISQSIPCQCGILVASCLPENDIEFFMPLLLKEVDWFASMLNYGTVMITHNDKYDYGLLATDSLYKAGYDCVWTAPNHHSIYNIYIYLKHIVDLDLPKGLKHWENYLAEVVSEILKERRNTHTRDIFN